MTEFLYTIGAGAVILILIASYKEYRGYRRRRKRLGKGECISSYMLGHKL